MSANQDAHLAITAAVHDAFSSLCEHLPIGPISIDDAILDDMLLACDRFDEKQ
ncbi:hypothetical protein [Rhodococcus sp. Leaf233]|uniref:hypothetical protein n=1 Tax=Rhodococcus sp. Leaf233 TaxID=1736302 RepID=UPI000AD9512B|nr:hypothetical protein [Rhodococcus sp. Leaf233]